MDSGDDASTSSTDGSESPITTDNERVVQYCRIYSIGTIREFRAAIIRETD